MRNFQQNRGWRNIVESRPVLIFLGVLVVVFAWGVVRFTTKMYATRENRIMAQNKLTELEEDQVRLNSEIAKLQTESGIEENIREKFAYAKEGEGLIVVVEDKNAPKVESKKTNWFSDFFKKLFK